MIHYMRKTMDLVVRHYHQQQGHVPESQVLRVLGTIPDRMGRPIQSSSRNYIDFGNYLSVYYAVERAAYEGRPGSCVEPRAIR